MPYIPQTDIDRYTVTRNGKKLDLVWDADTDKGEARIIATDLQGNKLANPFPDRDTCPYELLVEKGKIEAHCHTPPPSLEPPTYTDFCGPDGCCCVEDVVPRQLTLEDLWEDPPPVPETVPSQAGKLREELKHMGAFLTPRQKELLQLLEDCESLPCLMREKIAFRG